MELNLPGICFLVLRKWAEESLGQWAFGMTVVGTGQCVHGNFLYYFVEITHSKKAWEDFRFTLVLPIKLAWINNFKLGGTLIKHLWGSWTVTEYLIKSAKYGCDV